MAKVNGKEYTGEIQIDETTNRGFKEAAEELLTIIVLLGLPKEVTLSIFNIFTEYLHWLYTKEEVHPRASDILVERIEQHEMLKGAGKPQKPQKFDA